MPIYRYKCEECGEEEDVLILNPKDQLRALQCLNCSVGCDLIPGKRVRIMAPSSYIMKGFNEKNGYSNESR
jgi:predicted nucleic acid-binding Zn ribbon protein